MRRSCCEKYVHRWIDLNRSQQRYDISNNSKHNHAPNTVYSFPFPPLPTSLIQTPCFKSRNTTTHHLHTPQTSQTPPTLHLLLLQRHPTTSPIITRLHSPFQSSRRRTLSSRRKPRRKAARTNHNHTKRRDSVSDLVSHNDGSESTYTAGDDDVADGIGVCGRGRGRSWVGGGCGGRADIVVVAHGGLRGRGTAAAAGCGDAVGGGGG